VVLRVVSEYFVVPVSGLRGPRRSRSLVRARAVAVWLARQRLGGGFPAIGRMLGGRDGSTIRHACQQVEQRRAREPLFAAQLDGLSRRMENVLDSR
jgi:chromosomal replication initiator protein